MSRVRKWREKTVINSCAASPQSVAKNKIMSHARDDAIANQCVERKSVCVCVYLTAEMNEMCSAIAAATCHLVICIDVRSAQCVSVFVPCTEVTSRVKLHLYRACCGAYKFPSWFVIFWFERSAAEKTEPPNSWKEHRNQIALPNARCQIAHQSSLHLLLDALVFSGSLAQVPPHTHSAEKHRNLNV